MMNRLWVGIVGGILLLTAMGVYFVVGLDQPADEVKTIENIEEQNGDPEEAPDEPAQETTTENTFEKKVKTPLSEELIQQYIHAMSHQKVAAKEKWSFFEITDERIDFLLTQLEVNQYENEQLYTEILSSWKEGDFSNAVSHHNAVWNLQDGSIGKATGLLSPKEEEAFKQEWEKESR
jgi:Family of unknown function (DUF6241)